MKPAHLVALLVPMLAAAVPVARANETGHGGGHDSPDTPYAGRQAREIAALSAEDLAELRRGGGWGLALAAELNGAPGPTHLLELAERLELDARQVEAITAVRERMRADAIEAGERLIVAERALDRAFRDELPTAETLARLVAEAGEARAALRLVHLRAHLETPPLLDASQIDAYAVARGYAADPCAAVPAGHDADMWRRHNGCE